MMELVKYKQLKLIYMDQLSNESKDTLRNYEIYNLIIIFIVIFILIYWVALVYEFDNP